MDKTTPLLSLFPLEVVLFPGSTLPLHIFEPRYKRLIRDCLDQAREFGVVCSQRDIIAEVGTTARIVKVVKEYDDGRMDIETEGRRRFEILYENRDDEVLRAEVAFFDDDGEENPPGMSSLSESVRSIYTKIVLSMAKPNSGVSLVNAHPPRLAFAIAENLGLPLDLCQRLLGLRSEMNRLRELGEYLEEIFPKIERLQHTQTKTGGNGHLT